MRLEWGGEFPLEKGTLGMNSKSEGTPPPIRSISATDMERGGSRFQVLCVLKRQSLYGLQGIFLIPLANDVRRFVQGRTLKQCYVLVFSLHSCTERFYVCCQL